MEYVITRRDPYLMTLYLHRRPCNSPRERCLTRCKLATQKVESWDYEHFDLFIGTRAAGT